MCQIDGKQPIAAVLGPYVFAASQQDASYADLEGARAALMGLRATRQVELAEIEVMLDTHEPSVRLYAVSIAPCA